MPISVIPFNMPEPADIPSHIVDSLRSMEADEAVIKSMELLMQIEAANAIVYERSINNNSNVVGAVGDRSEELESILRISDRTLTGMAIEHNSPLLIMGQVATDDKDTLPNGLTNFLLNGNPTGSVGFNYVLPITTKENKILSTLTLFRLANEGPLNHEQPNICQAIRILLSDILDQN